MKAPEGMRCENLSEQKLMSTSNIGFERSLPRLIKENPATVS